jgi:site-specific DNA recombinase
MKAIKLARVSDEKQDSNEAQVTRLGDYIRTKQLEVWKTYEIEESSTRGDRKKFQQVIRDIEQSKEPVALVVDTIDRLQRSFRDSVILDELRKQGKLEIHFYREGLVVNKNSNSADLIRWDMGVMFARSYVLQLSDNVKRKNEQRRKNGEVNGRARIGYVNITKDDDKKDIEPDPERGHLIVRLFELYASGNYSITTLWQEMTKLGLRNKDGRPLSRSNIEAILKDRFYYGMAYSTKYDMLFRHRYPHLITRELFEKCQAILQKKNKMPAKMAAADRIFKGLINCPKCGCSYTPELKKGKYVTYACTNGKGICKRVYVSERILLEPIYELFKAFEGIPYEVQERLVDELRKSNEAEIEFRNREITRIRVEYDRCQKRIDRLTDLYLDGTSLTKDDYDKKLQELKDVQYRLNLELEEHTKGDHEYHIHVSTVLNLCRRIRAIFEGSEVSEKHAILNFVLSNLTVNDRKLSFSLRKPFDAILDLARSSNLAPQNGQVTNLPLDAFRAVNWTDFEREMQYSGILDFANKSI